MTYQKDFGSWDFGDDWFDDGGSCDDDDDTNDNTDSTNVINQPPSDVTESNKGIDANQNDLNNINQINTNSNTDAVAGPSYNYSLNPNEENLISEHFNLPPPKPLTLEQRLQFNAVYDSLGLDVNTNPSNVPLNDSSDANPNDTNTNPNIIDLIDMALNDPDEVDVRNFDEFLYTKTKYDLIKERTNQKSDKSPKNKHKLKPINDSLSKDASIQQITIHNPLISSRVHPIIELTNDRSFTNYRPLFPSPCIVDSVKRIKSVQIRRSKDWKGTEYKRLTIDDRSLLNTIIASFPYPNETDIKLHILPYLSTSPSPTPTRIRRYVEQYRTYNCTYTKDDTKRLREYCKKLRENNELPKILKAIMEK